MSYKSKEIKVEVKQKDIDEAVPGNSKSCPIALALVRTYGRRNWTVGAFLTSFDGSWELSPGSKLFIASFDSRLPVKPTKMTFKPLKEVSYE